MVPSATKLSEHFTAAELGADKPEADNAIVANLTMVAAYLEKIRRILSEAAGFEVPLKVNSGFRTEAHNDEVGGSKTSSHLKGLAGDFVPLNTRRPAGAPKMTMYRANRILRDAIANKQLPPFDQFIYYPIQGHIHVGLDPSYRKQTLIRIAENRYTALTDDLLDRLPGFGAVIGQVGSALSAVVDNQVSYFPLFVIVSIILLIALR